LGVELTRYASMSAEELIRACAESNDDAAWDEFVSRFQRAISISIIRVAYRWGQPARQIVDDLVQETYLKLCADKCHRLLEFAVRRPEEVTGYIKTTAINVAHDYFKSAYSQKRGAGRSGESLSDAEFKGAIESPTGPETLERQILLKQIDRCLDACSVGADQERDRLIFWLHYQQGMSAKAIAGLPAIGLTAKGVESAISRLTRAVRGHLVGLRDEAAGITQPDEKGFRPAESY
jgi:RNA polymerase sigma-70 factor (ECF subfamily)